MTTPTIFPAPHIGPKAAMGLRLDYLDGVRACAALYVIMIHAWTSQMGLNAHTGMLGWATNWVLYGHLPVDTFIVLSGFCLILPVARHSELRGGARLFFIRRAWRILPTFYAALVFSAILRLIEMHISHDAKGITLPGFVVNALLLQDLFPGGLGRQFSGPFWSVAVEWKIYFLFPLIVWMLLKRGPLPVLLFTAAVGYGIAGLLHWHDPQSSLEYTCPWYLFLFGMGVCAGHAAHAPQTAFSVRAWAGGGVAALLASLWMFHLWAITPTDLTTNAVHTPLTDIPIGVLVAVSLALMARTASGVRKLFSWSPLVRLGTFSYSLYLIHSALLKVFETGLDRLHIHGLLCVLVLLVICVPLIIACAYLFFLFFERPFLTRRPSAPMSEVAIKAALSPAP